MARLLTDWSRFPVTRAGPIGALGDSRYDWLGEVLEGNDLISSGLAMKFRIDVPDHTKVCSMLLDKEAATKLEHAVRNHYWCANRLWICI